MAIEKLLFSLGLIALGLLIGRGIKWIWENNPRVNALPMEKILRIMMKAVMLGLNPLIIIGAFWSVKLENMKLVMLPFLGIFALVLGGLLALGASRIYKLDSAKTGSMFVSGSFTNMGSFGTLFCFVLIGEESLVYISMFRLLEEFVYYLVGFPIAKLYGTGNQAQETLKMRIAKLLRDPFILVFASAIILGGLLNLSSWQRPSFYTTLDEIIVPLSTFLLVISIGFNMKVSAVRGYMKECFSISVVKFLLVPLCILAIGYMFGLGDIRHGTALKVILILSAMPPAFTSLIPPQLYKLDSDLANSSWIFNSVLLVLVVPMLYVIVSKF